MGEKSNPYVKFLYYFAKITGLAPFKLRSNVIYCESWRDHLPWSFMCIAICCCGLAITSNDIAKAIIGHSLDIGKIAGAIDIGTKLSAIIMCSIIFSRKRMSIVEIVGSFTEFDEIMKSFDTVRDYARVFRVRAIAVAITSFGFITAHYLCLFLLYITNTMKSDILIRFFVVIYGDLLLHHVIVIFVNIGIFVNERYRMINDSLQNVYASVLDQKRGAHRRRRILVANRKAPNSSAKLIKHIGKLHEKLCEAADKIVKLFAIPLFVIINHNFCIFLYVLYSTFSIVGILYETQNPQLISMLATCVITILIHILQLFSVAFVCASVQTSVSI